MVSDARKQKCRERKKKRLARQAGTTNSLRIRGGVRHVRDIARVSRNYENMKEQGLIKECEGCHMSVAILPTRDEDTQELIIYACKACNRELCPRCGVRAKTVRSPCCNLKGAERRPCLETDERLTLLLPCSGFDPNTRDPTKGCRRAIPASQYYGHIAECGYNLARINNPIGDLPEEILIPPSPPEIEIATTGEGSWENNDPAPPRSMFDAIEAGMQNPNLTIALPSWAVGIVQGGSRNSRRRQRQRARREAATRR